MITKVQGVKKRGHKKETNKQQEWNYVTVWKKNKNKKKEKDEGDI